MRILFVSTHLPVPATNGQAIRTLSMVRALATAGHELAFVSFSNHRSAKELDPLLSGCRTIDVVPRTAVNLSQGADYLGRLRCMARLQPYALQRFSAPAMRQLIQTHLDKQAFDVIVADSLYAMMNLPPTETPIVLNCHNVEHLIIKRFAELERNPMKAMYARWESRLLGKAEQRACLRSTIGLVCSEFDRDALARLCPTLGTFIVPNSVDTEYFSPVQPTKPNVNVPVVLFQGSMDWYPNRDAVEYFANEIFPLLRNDFPTLRFIVAGRNPSPAFIRKFARMDGIEFTGTVPDMRCFLAAATVAVVPLRLGSGTRIKILEACAMGKAVVSTRVGAEGLEFVDGKELLIADDAASFAEAVAKLLRDPQQRKLMGRLARSKVVERYSSKAVDQTLLTALGSLDLGHLGTNSAATPGGGHRMGSCKAAAVHEDALSEVAKR